MFGRIITRTSAQVRLAVDLNSKHISTCRRVMPICTRAMKTHSMISPKRSLSVKRSLVTNNVLRPQLIRGYATTCTMTEKQFQRLADDTMAQLTDIFDEIVEDVEGKDNEDLDVTYGNGVLTVDLGSFGTYVINKQTPNKQIWLSSPVCGPRRYDFDEDTKEWKYSHDGITITQVLSKELSDWAGKSVDVALDLDLDL